MLSDFKDIYKYSDINEVNYFISDIDNTETIILNGNSRKTTEPSVNENPISQKNEYTTMKVVSTSPKINIKKKPKSLNEPLLADISHSNSVIQNKDLNVSITG
jgi:hypothetical protein